MAGIQSLVLPLKHEAKPTLFINPPRAPPPPPIEPGRGGHKRKRRRTSECVPPKDPIILRDRPFANLFLRLVGNSGQRSLTISD